VENKKEQSEPRECGPDCACKTEKGLSRRTKIILLTVIILCAGAVLASAIVRKSRQAQVPTASSYTSALSLKSSAAPLKADSTSGAGDTGKAITFAMLQSLASLDTLAANFDGVFILMVKSDAEKTKTITQEIGSATTVITAKGMRMGVFQLAAGTPEFESLSAQIPSPGVIVVVKGHGMRAVAGNNITRTNLLQACIAAMQPSGCGASCGNRVCK
jgi:hypothetical protein